MFKGCENIISIDFFDLKTKNIKNMEYIFNECKNLETINLSSFDTQNVKYMSNMFGECSSLKSLPGIPKWNIKNVEN